MLYLRSCHKRGVSHVITLLRRWVGVRLHASTEIMLMLLDPTDRSVLTVVAVVVVALVVAAVLAVMVAEFPCPFGG